MISTGITSALVAALAYAVLAAASVALWKRTRTPGATTMAVGFALVLLAQVGAVIQQLEVNSLLRDHRGDTLFIVQHQAFVRCVLLLGLSLAALGLSWHSLRAAER